MQFSEELLRAVSQLEIRARRARSRPFETATTEAPFGAAAMQFKEFRHYEAGDDIPPYELAGYRQDRAGPTVKVFEEEREARHPAPHRRQRLFSFWNRQETKKSTCTPTWRLLSDLAGVRIGR